MHPLQVYLQVYLQEESSCRESLTPLSLRPSRVVPKPPPLIPSPCPAKHLPLSSLHLHLHRRHLTLPSPVLLWVTQYTAGGTTRTSHREVAGSTTPSYCIPVKMMMEMVIYIYWHMIHTVPRLYSSECTLSLFVCVNLHAGVGQSIRTEHVALCHYVVSLIIISERSCVGDVSTIESGFRKTYAWVQPYTCMGSRPHMY